VYVIGKPYLCPFKELDKTSGLARWCVYKRGRVPYELQSDYNAMQFCVAFFIF